jgi:hypothetical protein
MRCWFGRQGAQAASEALPRALEKLILAIEFDIFNGGTQRGGGYDSGQRHLTDCATEESRGRHCLRLRCSGEDMLQPDRSVCKVVAFI